MCQFYRLIVGMGIPRFQRFSDMGGGRRAVLGCQHEEGNLNGIMYAVAV